VGCISPWVRPTSSATRDDTTITSMQRIAWRVILRVLWDTRAVACRTPRCDHADIDHPITAGATRPLNGKNHRRQYQGFQSEPGSACLGPDTPALGARTNIATVTQKPDRATLASFLGLDYNASAPKAAPPITDMLRR